MRSSHASNILPFLLFQISLHLSLSEDNPCPPNYSGFLSGPGCQSYVICSNGALASDYQPCQPGTLFNQDLSLCDFEETVVCDTTGMPTERPTRPPTVPPTPRLEPTTPSPTLPPQTRSPSSNVGLEDALENAKWDINNKLLMYESGFEGGWLPSTVYRYDSMLMALQIVYLEGVGDLKFYVGEDVAGVEGVKIGLVNLAAFLAQSMKETIKYNACDENNWDLIDGKYPLSNACGQLEQSYQDYTCPEGMEHMQCEVDPNMELKATTTAMWYGAPGPLFCGPKTKYPFTGYWDYTFECDFPWKDPPEYCPDYEGQKGGRYDNSEPVENRLNRTDVEGCCWWGRGVIQTTGICNFGILNYYMGKRAADEGRDSRYPDLDFCKDPGLICSRDDHKELKWIAGFFYWMKSVQTYDSGWSYLDNLKSFVSGGMTDETFIDAVSGIVNRGCHNPPCANGSGQLDGGYERKENFKKVLGVLFEENGDPRIVRPSEAPTIGDPWDNTDSTTDPGYSSMENNFTSEITSSETEDNSEEWVDNDADWSAVASVQGTSGNVTSNSTDESTGSEGDSDTSDNVTSNVTNEWVDGDGVTVTSENVTSNSTDEWVDNEGQYDEEDWSTVEGGGASSSNLYCGESQFDATRNCGIEGKACPDGICSDGLKCYMVSGKCGSNSGSTNTDEENIVLTTPPSPAPINDAGIIDSGTLFPTVTSTGNDGISDSSFTSPAPASTDSSDDSLSDPTSESGFDISDTFFCGVDRADASTSCSKRCRSGSPGECPSGMSCFGYTPCTAEAGTVESVPSSLSTQSPSFSSGTNVGITQNYCAKSLDDIPNTCATAPTCNDGEPECPAGTYCWGDRLCGEVTLNDGSSKPTLSPSVLLETQSPIHAPIISTSPLTVTKSNPPTVSDQSTPADDEKMPKLYCASSMDELKASCSTAQNCDSGPCPTGSFCFPFDCDASQSTPTDEANTPNLYCASTIDELKQSCSTAQECDTGPCPSGTFCFPFDCSAFSEVNQITNQSVSISSPTGEPTLLRAQTKQPSTGTIVTSPGNSGEMLCPPTYTGWLSIDCIEYYECNAGSAGPIFTCPEGEKFDKVILKCNSAQLVNSFCYGPSLNQDEQLSGDSSHKEENGMCNGGRSGWEAAPGCREFYYCKNGHPDVMHYCGDGLLYDSELENCNFADQVACKENDDAAVSNNNLPPTQPTPLASPSPVVQQNHNLASTATEAVDDKAWSSTMSPTGGNNAGEMPPWLAHTVKGANKGTRSSSFLGVLYSLGSLLILTMVFQLDFL